MNVSMCKTPPGLFDHTNKTMKLLYRLIIQNDNKLERVKIPATVLHTLPILRIMLVLCFKLINQHYLMGESTSIANQIIKVGSVHIKIMQDHCQRYYSELK